jgi:hypothetical protein
MPGYGRRPHSRRRSTLGKLDLRVDYASYRIDRRGESRVVACFGVGLQPRSRRDRSVPSLIGPQRGIFFFRVVRRLALFPANSLDRFDADSSSGDEMRDAERKKAAAS